jgi:hypothetical protein
MAFLSIWQAVRVVSLAYFFLKSSRWEPISLYHITSDNPQKDNFRNLILGIDKMVIFGTVNSIILIKFLFPEDVGDGAFHCVKGGPE